MSLSEIQLPVGCHHRLRDRLPPGPAFFRRAQVRLGCRIRLIWGRVQHRSVYRVAPGTQGSGHLRIIIGKIAVTIRIVYGAERLSMIHALKDPLLAMALQASGTRMSQRVPAAHATLTPRFVRTMQLRPLVTAVDLTSRLYETRPFCGFAPRHLGRVAIGSRRRHPSQHGGAFKVSFRIADVKLAKYILPSGGPP